MGGVPGTERESERRGPKPPEFPAAKPFAALQPVRAGVAFSGPFHPHPDARESPGEPRQENVVLPDPTLVKSSKPALDPIQAGLIKRLV